MRFFKGEVYLFCCQRLLKNFIDFNENVEMSQILEGGGGGHVICVIMRHYVRKSIRDSPL